MNLKERFLSLIQRKWWSIRLLYLVFLISQTNDASKYVYLYPYLRVLNPGVTLLFYSWVVGIVPIGQIIASPLYGLWYNRVSTRQPISLNLTLLFLSNILYSCCNLFSPDMAIWMVLVSRLLMGMTNTSRVVTNSYIASATTVEERSAVMSNLLIGLSIGYIIGPLMGLMCQPLGYPGYTISYIGISFNMYTTPGFIIAILTLINLVLMIWFKEFIVNPLSSRRKCKSCFRSRKSVSLISEDSPPEEGEVCNHPQNAPYDKLPMMFLGVSMFIIYTLVTITDALISPYSLDEFAWSKETANFYNNIIMMISGVAAFFGILFMKSVLKCISVRMTFLIGFLVASVSFFLCIPWPGDIPQLIHQVGSNESAEMVGCDYLKQPWCLTVPKIHEFQFSLSPIIFFFSLPILHVTTIILATEIIGPHPPGVILGLIGTSASLGRGSGPIILVPLFFKYGPQITYACIDGVVIVVILLTLVTYRRLVPYGTPRTCF